jgi:microcystin-dependent protein
MTESSGFHSAPGDTHTYTQTTWLEHVRDLQLDGIVYGSLNTFVVTQQASPNMTVKVDTGECWVQGDWYQSDAAQNATITAADATYPRIDLVVLRNYIVGSRKICVYVIAGTPAASPTAPGYTRNINIWDMPIAQIAVGAGVTSIVTANITDLRTNETYSGYAKPRNVRITDAIPGNALDLLTYGLTGVGLCTDNQDLATYDYAISRAVSIPAGFICAFAGLTIPSGWLECNGQAFSSDTYPNLYAQLGSTNTPDLRGRTPMGYDATQSEFNTVGMTGGEDKHTLTIPEMPSHSHTGCWVYSTSTSSGMTYTSHALSTASGLTSAGSGTAHENRPPYMVMKWIIKAD